MPDRDEPATKGDIEDLKQELKQELKEEFKQELKQELAIVRSEMQHMYNDMVERMSDIETKLLKAFYTFAESNQKRLSETERENAGLKERLSILETRMLAVEKRLNMPPAA
jgi:hypothetical protein